MTITMAVFGEDPFTAASMIRGIDKRTYIPNGLDAIIGFEPKRVGTDTIYIGQTNRSNGIIQTTLRGAPIEMRSRPDKNFRPLKIPRVAEGDQLYIHELANLVPWEGETEIDLVAQRIVEMQEDLIGDVEMTEENMRLGSLNGTVLDKDGSTIVNYYTEFGISVPSAIDLTLDNPNMTIGELREKIGSLIAIPIAQGIKAGSNITPTLRAVCGDGFWFKLTGHPAVEKTYEGYAAAAERREATVWETFNFGGVMWFHYRGTDDGSTIAISSNQAKIFPYRLSGMFQHVMGPCNEMEETLNQLGRRYYPVLERDQSSKKQWVQPEIYAYPLFVNARPDLVLTATV
jgi:hypothetical protein